MWSQPQTDNSPGPRAAHSCDLVRNLLYLFGGWNGKKALNDLWNLDLVTLTWSLVETDGKAPSARNNHSSVVVGHKLFVHGGHDGSKWLSDFFYLDTITHTWCTVETSGQKPTARACHTITRLGRKLYMFGGYDGSRCFNDVDVLDLDTFTWMQPLISGTQPTPRNAHTMTVCGTELFMFGGHSGNKHLRDLFQLNTETMTWNQVSRARGTPPPGLRGHSANLVGHKVFLFGGYDGRGRSNELYVLNMENMSWERPISKDTTPAGRQRHTACLVGTRLFLFGGFDGFKWLQDMHILDIGKLEEHAITNASVSSLISNLKNLLNNAELYSDVTFLVEDKPIHSHKAILAAQCDHFKAMFSCGMVESRQSQIVIPEWGYSAFLQMLEFLYTGRIDNFTFEDALELLGLADHYNLTGLGRLSENTLVHGIDDENVCIVFTTANHYQATALKQNCMSYILKNLETVVQTKGFESLGAEPQLLLEVTRASMQHSVHR